MSLNNQSGHWKNQKGKQTNKNYVETNKNKKHYDPNLWDAAKTILRGKFTAIYFHLKKQEKNLK